MTASTIELPHDPRLDEEMHARPADAPPADVYNTPAPASDEEPSIQERFERFHADNPWVYAELRRRALRLAQLGRRNVGVKMLWESLRHDHLADPTVTGDGPKFDNSLTSRYARLLIQNEPHLAEVIRTRALRS